MFSNDELHIILNLKFKAYQFRNSSYFKSILELRNLKIAKFL